MNEHSDIERVLTAWFDDGPSTMPDRVVDVVADRVGRQSQRRAWRLDWRQIHMTTTLKFATAAVAVAIVAILGYNLLPSRSNGVGGGPAPTVAPTTATPSPTPTPSPSPAALKPGVQGPGTFTGQFGASPIPWTVTLPKGWAGYDSDIVMGPQRPGDKGTAILTERAVNVPKDSCAPEGTVPAASAEEFLAAVEARKDWDVSDRKAATIGAYPATRIDIVLPEDPSICGNGKDYMVVAKNDGTGFHLQGPSMHVTYWVAEVNGEPLFVERFSFAETPTSDLAESDAVVDSIEITP